MIIQRADVRSLCRSIAGKHGLDWTLVAAVCEKESEKDGAGFKMDVARLEQGFYRRYVEPMTFATTTEILLSASYGIMQMMGQSLLERGFFDWDWNLREKDYQTKYVEPMSEENVPKAINRYCIDAGVQVEFGCRHLKYKIDRAGGNIAVGLDLWNGDSTGAYHKDVLSKQELIQKGKL